MIHVLFSSSAAGTLRQLLRSRGIRDRVVDLTESLDVGWISSDRIEDRIQWFNDRMPWKGNWDWAADCVREFLDRVYADEDRLIWLAPQAADEHSGFLWYLHQTGAPPNQMIIADFPLAGAWRGKSPHGLGELGEDMMAEFLDHAPRKSWDEARFPLEKWRTLMDDGAVLRIIENGALRSAQSDHYDDWLLRWCPPVWTKWYRVVGDAMGHADQVLDYLFLEWRLQELICSGAIECQGKLPPWERPSMVEPARIRRLV